MRVWIDELAAEDPRVQLEALGGHLLSEATQLAHRIAQPLRSDEGAGAVAHHHQLLLLEKLQRLANRHHRDAVALGQLALGRETLAWREGAALDLRPEIPVDPQVMRRPA